MRALVVANCTTQTYVEGLQKLFPDWEVRGVAADLAEEWLADGSRPEFDAYLGACDLYVGEPPGDRHYGTRINPAADKVLIPSLHFRGLHPDIAVVPGFRGPLTFSAPNTQASLVTLAARALDMGAADTAALFRSDIYRELGFFDLYKTEKKRILALFLSHGINLTEEFAGWEKIGDFFYVCHHPRAVVLIDILRRALAGRYLDAAAFAASADLARLQTDHLATMEIWPVYPELAKPLGFGGSLTWVRGARPAPIQLSLGDFIEATFETLDAAGQDWRSLPFVTRAAALIRMHEARPPETARLPGAGQNEPDRLAQLTGDERAAVDAAREAPHDGALLHDAMNLLRSRGKLAELEQLYDAAPAGTQTDHAVISVWCSIPRIRKDGPEAVRRATEMLRHYPDAPKSAAHMIFALQATAGYAEAMQYSAGWMARFPDTPDLIGPTAVIAIQASAWADAETYFRLLDRISKHGLDAGEWRLLVLALRRQGKDADAAAALEEGLRKHPGHSLLVGF